MAWCCARCWYNERFRAAKEAGKKFTSTKDAQGHVEVFFDGEWAGMCQDMPAVCPNRDKQVTDEAA